jgi:hypothetical protein
MAEIPLTGVLLKFGSIPLPLNFSFDVLYALLLLIEPVLRKSNSSKFAKIQNVENK